MAKDDKKEKKSILDKLAEEVDKISDNLLKKDDKEKKGSGKEEQEARKEAKKPVTSKKRKTEADKDEEEKANSPMGKLMEQNPIDIPEVGDVVKGTVVDVASNMILLDLGPLGTGVVMGKETKDGLAMGVKLKKGNEVSATLVDLENDDGYIELSIREASHDKAWEDISSKRDGEEVVVTKILDANKGGLMVEVNGIKGFLPVSQLSSENYPRVEDGDKNKILEMLKMLVGKELNVRILDAEQETEKLIVSEKAAMSEQEKQIISSLKVGDVVDGEVSGVVDFGAFIKFTATNEKNEEDQLEGLVHISELAWQLIDDPREIIKTGDSVKAKIIGIDNTRISLSVKALKVDPWSKIAEKYKTGDIVKGKVDKINPFGAFVYLDKDIHGLAHVSEFQESFPGQRMDVVLKEGEKYDWKIASIEQKEHRMGLVYIKDKKAEMEKTNEEKKTDPDREKAESKKDEKKTEPDKKKEEPKKGVEKSKTKVKKKEVKEDKVEKKPKKKDKADDKKSEKKDKKDIDNKE